MKTKTPFRTLFHSVTTTERHRKIGYCEPSDFGKIILYEVAPEDKQLIVSFKKYISDPMVEYVEFNGQAFRKIDTRNGLSGLSREDDKAWGKKQGKFSEQTAKQLVLKIREGADNRFSNAGSETFLLIGRTLYESYCPANKLSITVASNLLFSCWLSIDIESHGGKTEYKLSKSNFDKVFKAQKKRFEDAKPEKGKIKGDGHIGFSAPTQITWGEKYSK